MAASSMINFLLTFFLNCFGIISRIYTKELYNIQKKSLFHTESEVK